MTTTTTDLQTLLDERLGKHGPWHEATSRLRAQGYGWESVAGRLRVLAGLDVDRLRGETLRRWMVRRQAEAAEVRCTLCHPESCADPEHSLAAVA